MRISHAFLVPAAVVLFTLALAQPAQAQEASSIPTALEQIGDPLFRDALAMYSPSYNSLSRGDQVLAYVNMYKVLYNGQTPPLSPHESSVMSQSQQRQYRRPEPQLRTEFPIWDQPPVLLQDRWEGTGMSLFPGW